MVAHPSTDHDVEATPSDPRRWRALALLGIAQFMLILDVTVVTIALPDIGADLQLGRATLTWVITAYTMLFGGLMLLGGRAADLFGARRIVLIGLVTFTVASLVTGLAVSAPMLIGGRLGQGIGAALLSPAPCRSSPPPSTAASAPRPSGSGVRSPVPARPSGSYSAAC